jgi:hypothetical protein
MPRNESRQTKPNKDDTQQHTSATKKQGIVLHRVVRFVLVFTISTGSGRNDTTGSTSTCSNTCPQVHSYEYNPIINYIILCHL